MRAREGRNSIVVLSIIVMLGAAILPAIMAGVMGVQSMQKGQMQSQIDTYQTKIDSAIKNNKFNHYLTVQNQLSQIDALKGSQPHYSRIYDFLRQLNPAAPNAVTLNNLTITAPSSDSKKAGQITMEGTTSSFVTLNNYKTVLEWAKLYYIDADTVAASVQDKADDKSDDKSGDNKDNQPEVTDWTNANMTDDQKSLVRNRGEAQPLYTNINVTKASLAGDSATPIVNFTLTMNFNSNAFKPQNAVLVELPADKAQAMDTKAAVFNGPEEVMTDQGQNQAQTSGVILTSASLTNKEGR